MTDNSLNLSQVIRKRLNDDGARYWAGDNISKYITDKEKDLLVDELTEKFEGVLDSLIIDRFKLLSVIFYSTILILRRSGYFTCLGGGHCSLSPCNSARP